MKDHPWSAKGQFRTPAGALHDKHSQVRPPRTIRDELHAAEIARALTTPDGLKVKATDVDLNVRPDPSYAQTGEGTGRRVPVRYD